MSAATPSGNVSQNHPLDLNLLTALANVDHPHATTEQMWTLFERMAQQVNSICRHVHWAKNIQHLANDGHATALKTKSYDVADDASNILFQNHKI
eukprot:254936_1